MARRRSPHLLRPRPSTCTVVGLHAELELVELQGGRRSQPAGKGIQINVANAVAVRYPFDPLFVPAGHDVAEDDAVGRGGCVPAEFHGLGEIAPERGNVWKL